MDFYAFALTPWFWLAVAVLCFLIEMLSAWSLTTIWGGIAALLMVFVAGFTEMLDAPLRFRLHIGIFLVITIVLLIFTRPLIVKKLKVGRVKTNVDALVGADCVVIKKIGKFEKGEVKIRGAIWSALSEDGAEIEEGAECTIIRIEGVKAIVARKA